MTGTTPRRLAALAFAGVLSVAAHARPPVPGSFEVRTQIDLEVD